MSERYLKRTKMLSDVRAGRLGGGSGSDSVGRERAPSGPIMTRYDVDGGSGLIHRSRGRTSNRSRNEGIRKYAVELVRTRYACFGPTLATKVLLESHQLRIGKEIPRR